MTSDPERDEAELRALFDRTADIADGPGLTKLRARAADVPGLGRRRSWWWVFVPFVAVAAGALIVVSMRGGSAREQALRGGSESAIVAPSSPEVSPSALALQSSRPPPSSAGEANPEEAADLDSDEAVADLGADDEGNGGDLFAALDEPADEDVDAWLAATSAYLEGG